VVVVGTSTVAHFVVTPDRDGGVLLEHADGVLVDHYVAGIVVLRDIEEGSALGTVHAGPQRERARAESPRRVKVERVRLLCVGCVVMVAMSARARPYGGQYQTCVGERPV